MPSLLKPPQCDCFYVFNDLIYGVKGEFQTALLLVVVEQVIDILGNTVMNGFVVGPVNLTVSCDDLGNCNGHFGSKIRRNLCVLRFIEDSRQDAVKSLGVYVVLDGLRVGNSAFPGMIIFHDGAHLCQILGFRNNFFFVLFQRGFDTLGKTVIVGRVFLILGADAFGQLAGNGICFGTGGAQTFQFALKIILVQDVNGAGNLLETSYRKMCIQQVLH